MSVVEAPTYIVTPSATEMSSGSASKGIQKKHVLIVIGMIITAGMILAGILVGMYIFAEAQKEIIKFSLDFKSSTDGKNVKQEVESDPNDNVVMYHVTKDGQNVQIVNDFNRDIQVVKMESDSGVNCYVSPLNRSAALNPSQITGPDYGMKANDNSSAGATVFTVSSSPITDRSFLPKKAQDMCKSVSVYWAYRSCGNQNGDESDKHDRQRRAVCITSCCLRVCSCSIRLVQVRVGTRITCNFYNTCPYDGTYQRVC